MSQSDLKSPTLDWPNSYRDLVNRNLGLLTEREQERLRRARVAICGLGGLGGIVAEVLARTGVELFRLLDNGTFEATNSNRQIYSFTDTSGLLKTDVTEGFLKRINPNVMTEKYLEASEANVSRFLEDVDVVVLALDAVLPILLLSREARRRKIPLVEGWALAYGNVRVITEKTPSLEELYGFPTIGRKVSSVTPEEVIRLGHKQVVDTIGSMKGLSAYYPESVLTRLQEKGEGTTFAPFVWLTSVMMALEVCKVLLGWGEVALAPQYTVYDGLRRHG